MKHFINYKIVCILLMLALYGASIRAQDSFEKFKREQEEKFSQFKSDRDREYNEFRRRINSQYAEMVRLQWQAFNAVKGIPKPIEQNVVPPVVYPQDDKDKPIKEKETPVIAVIAPVKPVPQPQPIVPVPETKPTTTPEKETYIDFSYCNTPMRVRLDSSQQFSLKNCGEKEIARCWDKLASTDYNNTIHDCLGLRQEKALCDWAYLQMLQALSEAFFKRPCNEATLLTAYIYSQSGYKMRLATANNKLILLFASQHQIYDTRYWEVEGENFYALHSDADNIYISSATFPNEKPLSLYINKEPILKTITSKRRRLASKQYLMCAITETNQNLVDFYNTYPVSTINNDFGTRWALYANTPLSETARQSLYPSLNRAIKHYNQIIAVKKLLNWVQTAFVYKLDDEVWGHDRAFFAEESLYYPYCDCEDRSILFSRIVRDLVGLDVVLIYYPGHLATAVRFTEAVQGDYVTIGNQRYTICDPTYIGAPIGRTMPGMDNSQAKVIILN